MFGRLLTNDEDDDKTSLEDEFDDSGVSEIVGGKLSFNEGDGAAAAEKFRSWSGVSDSSGVSPKRCSQRVSFEIVSAKTITDTKKKYVSYTVLVKRAPRGLMETRPGVLERRYSDFLRLFQTLRRRQPRLLGDFPFPRKALMGNFTAEVITERSVAFRHLLALCQSVRELQGSAELAEFLHRRELLEAHQMMRAARFEDAAVMLENVYFVQEKVLEERHHLTFYSLCVLVACLNAVDNVSEAQRYAEAALGIAHERSELTPPLLTLCVRLWWAVGKDKRALERRLEELRRAGLSNDRQPTLLELVLHRECPLPPPPEASE